MVERPEVLDLPAEPGAEGRRRPPFLRLVVREVLQTVAPAVLIALLINLLLGQFTLVLGRSMEPNLEDHQRLVLEKVSYRFREPERGDIVALWPPFPTDLPLIKRVVALPGERVSIQAGRVYIDGNPLQEPYLAQRTNGYLPQQVVPEGHVFVLGDNRGASNDSRVFGPVAFGSIVGRAWLSCWPLERAGWVQ
ncbi:MAG: signal peptidase I [Chloroflexi bacterium]|nr:signal peptidase I [Chloroflexota bacterium]